MSAPREEEHVEVRQSVLDDLLAHARESMPEECCGILIGHRGRIERSARARNQLKSTTRYVIEPEDHFAAIRGARATGEAVVGFYHSHPSSEPVPSPTDEQEAAYAGHCYLIVSPGGQGAAPQVRGFRLDDGGNFTEVKLVPFA